jgi:hypothetical protein
MPGFAPRDPSNAWARHVVHAVGQDAFLDSATAYYLESMSYFLSPGEESGRRACIEGQRALMDLREAVDRYSDEQDPANLLLTIVLHRYAEVSAKMDLELDYS